MHSTHTKPKFGVAARAVLAVSLLLPAAMLGASRADAQGAEAAADSSPCLKELNDQKSKTKVSPADAKPKAPGWWARNVKTVVSGLGAATGVVIANNVCKDATPEQRAQCRMLGGLGGLLLGSKLGQAMSEAEQKRYQEATYKVALTGRPQSITLEKGCLLVEPAAEETFEERQIELAFGSTVTTPPKLRAVAVPYVRASSANVLGEPSVSKGMSKIPANAPSFVMGSIDGGRWLLLGREDADQGFVGAGYVDAKGWVAAPDSTPTGIDAADGPPKLVTVGVEVPCRQISSSIRVEASNKQETYVGRVCRLPNGISETQ